MNGNSCEALKDKVEDKIETEVDIKCQIKKVRKINGGKCLIPVIDWADKLTILKNKRKLKSKYIYIEIE